MGVEGAEATQPPPATTGLELACGGAGVARGTGWRSSPAGVGSQPRMEKASTGGRTELLGPRVGAGAEAQPVCGRRCD